MASVKTNMTNIIFIFGWSVPLTIHFSNAEPKCKNLENKRAHLNIQYGPMPISLNLLSL